MGFVNGTCINGTTLTEEAMETHQPGGQDWVSRHLVIYCDSLARHLRGARQVDGCPPWLLRDGS